MRKYIFAVLAVLCLVLTSATVQKFKSGDSVLKNGVVVYGIPAERRFIPFMDTETGKIGFLRNNSDLNIAVPPTYDAIYNDVYLLLAVEKDGKWGVIDLGGRFFIPRDDLSIPVVPIIPCSYNKVKVLSNRKVDCDGYIIDVYDDLRYRTYDALFY